MKKIFFIAITLILSSSYSYCRQLGDDIYYHPQQKHNGNDMEFMNYIIPFGVGAGIGQIKVANGMTHNSFDLDLIAVNVLISCKLGKIANGGNPSYDATSLQFGLFLPTIGFGKEDWVGRKHKAKIFVAPLIEFVHANKTYIDGHYLHHIEGHNCQCYIDTSTTSPCNDTGFGGALMLKYNMGYVLGKITNKGFGVSALMLKYNMGYVLGKITNKGFGVSVGFCI